MNLGYRAVAFAILAAEAHAQVSSNASLTGKYFFRQVALQTSTGATVSQTQSASGTLTFDGNGNFTMLGQQLTGTASAAALSGNGTYTVSPGGFVTLSNPLLTGVTMSARLGTEALLGSSTEAGPNVFDLLIAVRGPTSPVTNGALTGPYWVSSLEFPNGGVADIRNTNFELTANGQGQFAETSVTGQAANLGDTLLTQAVSPMSYLLSSDGSGTMTFPASAGLDITTQLIEGVKNVYLSQDGNFFIGGSTAAGGHGLIVGVKAFAGGTSNSATNASWTGLYFAAGMRFDRSPARLASVLGSVNPTPSGAVWERRTHQSDGLFDATPLITYSLNADGSGIYTSTSGHMDLASNALVFSTSGVDVQSSTSYELYLGTSVLAQSGQGPGPFLNPLGILNAGSYVPPGFPVSPGGFVALFGTGLAAAPAQAKVPFPIILGQTQVKVNGASAPVYAVSATQINAVVPYGVTGTTATFVVNVNGVASNSVTVPLAPTAPGVFSLTANGLGDGAILHADNSVVNQANPAMPGEIVEVFLTGLGAVNPAVPDGTAAPSKPLAIASAPLNVYVGGLQVSNIQFQGLSPGLASLYQLNIQIPLGLGPGPQPLALQTASAFTDLVDLWLAEPQ